MQEREDASRFTTSIKLDLILRPNAPELPLVEESQNRVRVGVVAESWYVEERSVEELEGKMRCIERHSRWSVGVGRAGWDSCCSI